MTDQTTERIEAKMTEQYKTVSEEQAKEPIELLRLNEAGILNHSSARDLVTNIAAKSKLYDGPPDLVRVL